MVAVVAVLMELSPEHRHRTTVDADFGRAAGFLGAEGIEVVVADAGAVVLRDGGARVWGYAVDGSRWAATGPLELRAAFNRLPARHAGRHGELVEKLEERGIPVGNPPQINALALDKLRAAEVLREAGLPVPDTEARPQRFQECLRRWGAAFHKPRFGSFGEGVSRLVRGQDAAATIGGSPALLQRAIDPPARGPAGICVRGLLQRDPGGAWVSAGRVARVHRRDPVANVARGARGVPLPWLERDLWLSEGLADQLDRLEPRVAEALERCAGARADRLVEIGVDWVLDPCGDPWLIEINGKPGGHLRVLAAIPGPEGPVYARLHREALTRPFRTLAALARRRRGARPPSGSGG